MRKIITPPLNDENLGRINENFSELFRRVENAIEQISQQIWNKIVDQNTINLGTPVNNLDDLPSKDAQNTIRYVIQEQKIYAFNGEKWIPFEEVNYDPYQQFKKELDTAVTKYKTDLTNQLDLSKQDLDNLNKTIADSLGSINTKAINDVSKLKSEVVSLKTTFENDYANKTKIFNEEYTAASEDLKAIQNEVENAKNEIEANRDEYPQLNEKVNTINETLDRDKLNQTDFVDKLSRLMQFDEVQVKKSNETTFTVSCYNRTTNRHITNLFTKNANDDYFIMSESYIGGTSIAELPKEYVNYTKVSGTIDTNYATHFATEIGTKIKANITGTEIYMRRYGDNRGGVWEFIIDGDTSNKVKVTTFKNTAGTDDFKIATGLNDTNHLIEGTFLGDDSNNPPSSGTSRGWLPYSATTETTKTFFSRFNNVNMSRDKVLNAALSNKDFALRIRPKGSTGEYHFVPEHNAIGTAFKINAPKFLLDGKELDIFSLPVGVSMVGKKFTLVQSVYGRYPTGAINLLRIDNIHEISLNSSVRMFGKVSVLQDIEIQDGYFLMLPVTTDVATRLKTSRFNDYNTKVYDGSQTKLTTEKDDTTSFVFTSEVNTDLFSALKVNDPYHSLRTNQEGKFPIGQTAWIEHRNNSMQKLYQSIYRLSSVTAGTNLYYDGVYLSGEMTNIHNLM